MKIRLLALLIILVAARRATAEPALEELRRQAEPNGVAAVPTVPTPDCDVKEFTVRLEGWTRDSWKTPTPCSVEPIVPQPETCDEAPCLNLACKALLHFHAVVELPEGVKRIWPACYFKQQRMGLRAHHDAGARKLDQYEPQATYDFDENVQDAVGFRLSRVPGAARRFTVDFYDLPGWYAKYWNGRPNAVSPVWFPLEWHYMYRSYFGPKRPLQESDYQAVRIDMEASAGVAGMALRQAPATAEEWRRFSAELLALPHLVSSEMEPGPILPAISGFGTSP